MGVAGETDGAAGDVRVVDRDGDRFAVVDADERTTVSELLDASGAVQSGPDDGVVVRAPAEAEVVVEALVEEIERSRRSALGRVETEVVETTAGRQYRTYLRATERDA